jgi:hypothetical protein
MSSWICCSRSGSTKSYPCYRGVRRYLSVCILILQLEITRALFLDLDYWFKMPISILSFHTANEFKDNHGIRHYEYCSISVTVCLRPYSWKPTRIRIRILPQLRPPSLHMDTWRAYPMCLICVIINTILARTVFM